MTGLRGRYRRALPDRVRRVASLRPLRNRTRARVNAWRYNRALPGDAPVLNFYPRLPPPNAKILRAMRRLGLRIGHQPRGDQPTIAWEGAALLRPEHAARLPSNAINRHCLDLRKSTVDRAWAEVAGYTISVDPLAWDDVLVVKSEENGLHDGQLVIGPLRRRRSGVVYQRLVDSREGDRIKNYRAFLVGTEIVLLFEVWRVYPHWFSSVGMAMPRRPSELLSEPEIEQVLRFAAALGMDYGEIDIVRDRHSGLIYAVDANRTPLQGALLNKADYTRTYRPLADALGRLLADWRPLEAG